MSRPEPMTVTSLRQQIRRGATLPVLYRIAGGSAEFDRLDVEYGLTPRRALPLRTAETAPPPARDRRSDEFLPKRQGELLALIEYLARQGAVFPPVMAIAKLLDCSWLVVERDLRMLEKRQLILIGQYRCEGTPVRRVEIRGKGLQTALPPLNPLVASAVVRT
jgi:hypothetical protein